MMGSVGFGEILVICLVVLIVFGPNRLPELARKIGDLLAKARSATREFVDAIDGEYREGAAPLRNLKEEYDAARREISDSVARLTDISPSDSAPAEPPRDEGKDEPEDEGPSP